MQALRRFHQAFYSSNNKIEQDHFIVRYTIQKAPKRFRGKHGEASKKTLVSTFYVKTKSGNVQVCKGAFMSILGIGKSRLQRLCKQNMHSCVSPREKRGGDTKSKKYEIRKQSVMEFIRKLPSLESHYTRGKSTRQYLSSDLSITKLWKHYNEEAQDNLKVKYVYFRNIFNYNFNLSFKSPATDVCSTCISLKSQIKDAPQREKVSLMTKLRVHRLKYKAFYSFIQTEEENVIKISCDCQKNNVLPKVQDQSTYYSRQLYIYNFTICEGHSKSVQTKDKVKIYTWTEDQRGKGSNEIASMLFHYLQNMTIPENVTKVHLYADGCPAQTKNTIVVGMILKWLSELAPNQVEEFYLIFPIVGHSFLPPDRVFGRIEKVLKKIETVITPEEYNTIFASYGKVVKCGVDFQVYNWKDACQGAIRKPANWHFKFAPSKRILLKKNANTGKVLIKGEVNYRCDLGRYKSILKAGKNVSDIDPRLLPNIFPVKKEKMNDVDKLLKKHFGNEWRQLPDLEYYKNVLDREYNFQENLQTAEDDVVEDEENEEVLRI